MNTSVGQTHPLLEVRDLYKEFEGPRRWLKGGKRLPVRAVDGVSFTLEEGETLGLVGESGCGKSTLARLLVRLIEPSSGEIHFRGENVTAMDSRTLRAWRPNVQIILQDPYSSLDPKMTVREILMEPFHVHQHLAKDTDPETRIRELLSVVGLNTAALDRYPHQFSGGQQQRISIARGLSVEPDVIICDEPVSALDVSVQAQVINLLKDIQDEFGLSYIFISHDLSVVRSIADRMAVMYLGKIVEYGNEDACYERPSHPYTQALLSAVPVPDPDVRLSNERHLLTGEIPNASAPPGGCNFRTRCWKADELCRDSVPELTDRLGTGSLSACHYAEVDPPSRAEKETSTS